MKIAIFSDVHSNLPALEAVLSDIKRQRVSMRVCLGDIVGYNAEPAVCVERARRACDYVIQGNHDKACAVDLDIADFSSTAQAGIQYSRAHLSAETQTISARSSAFENHRPLDLRACFARRAE